MFVSGCLSHQCRVTPENVQCFLAACFHKNVALAGWCDRHLVRVGVHRQTYRARMHNRWGVVDVAGWEFEHAVVLDVVAVTRRLHRLCSTARG